MKCRCAALEFTISGVITEVDLESSGSLENEVEKNLVMESPYLASN